LGIGFGHSPILVENVRKFSKCSQFEEAEDHKSRKQKGKRTQKENQKQEPDKPEAKKKTKARSAQNDFFCHSVVFDLEKLRFSEEASEPPSG
jgi:hypothetical protein